MPTIPLNLLAFLSEWRLCEWRKGVPCRHLRPQKRHSHSAWAYAVERSSLATRTAFLQAAWLGSYCTGSSLLDQPRRVPQISSALSGGFRERIEKRDCRAPQ